MLQLPLHFDRSVAVHSWQGILVATSLFMGLTGCQSAILTTRFQPHDNWHEKQEVVLGAKVYQEILDTEPKSQDAQLSQMLDRVGQRIAAASDHPDYQWEFTLLSGPKRDACCLPGGKVVVYEGLLPVCAHEAGLAVVLSHEIAHILSHHGREQMSAKIRASEGDPAFGRIQVGRDSKRIEMLKSVYGLGTHDSSHVPFSRTQEDEADSIGLLLMARAGYDPQEAPRFWDRFQSETGPAGPDLLSKHPLNDTRTAKLSEIVPRALSVYQNAPQRYGVGERFQQEVFAQLDLEQSVPVKEEPLPPAPVGTVPSQAATPLSSIAAVSIAPAPIVQVGHVEAPAETPVDTTPRVDDSISWADFGAPTVEGTPDPLSAGPIVTASLAVIAPPDVEPPEEAPVSLSEQDWMAGEELSSEFPTPESTRPPARETAGDWKPHQE
jgi:metalloendopeptidase OMA1, mitochondrial